MATKTFVLGENANSGWYGVGPVYKDETVDQIRDLIEQRGDTCRGQVQVVSYADFRAETVTDQLPEFIAAGRYLTWNDSMGTRTAKVVSVTEHRIEVRFTGGGRYRWEENPVFATLAEAALAHTDLRPASDVEIAAFNAADRLAN